MENDKNDQFGTLVNSMKGSEEGDEGLLRRLTPQPQNDPESSQAIGQKAMNEVMAKAAADKAKALQGTGPGLKSRV